MEYISVAEAAEKWNVSIRRVQFYCSDCKIPGAINMGKQWIIPKDAERPIDGRTKKGRKYADAELYHFPLLIYTKYYSDRSSLNEEEQALLDAQILYHNGKFAEALENANNLYDKTSNSTIKFGCQITIAYCSMLLGLYTIYTNAMEKASRIIMAEEKHLDDFRLVYYMATYHTSWDFTPILSIDNANLSIDANTYYIYALILNSSFVGKQESENAIKTYETLCTHIEHFEIYPLSAVLHFLIASLYMKSINTQKVNYHVKKGLQTCFDNNFSSILSKYYNFCSGVVSKALPQKISQKVKSGAEKNYAGWLVINKQMHDISPYGDIDRENVELVHLLVYGMSTKDISAVLGISQTKINARIKKVCDYLGLENKRALEEYAKASFNGILNSK